MFRPLYIGILVCSLYSLSLAGVECIHQGELQPSSRDLKRIERKLVRDFPSRILQRRAHGKGLVIAQRVVYLPVKLRSRNFVLAVSPAKWSDYASRLSIYRIYRDSIVRLYTSRSWIANYPTYSLDAMDQVVMLKEGVDDDARFSLASFFTFEQGKNGLYIRDLTPKLAAISVKVEFPFRPLYAKGIALLKQDPMVVVASDGFLKPSRWSYDKARRRFQLDKQPVITAN